jgi:hypothetical protein
LSSAPPTPFLNYYTLVNSVNWEYFKDLEKREKEIAIAKYSGIN